mgnify:CR=1 FL=1
MKHRLKIILRRMVALVFHHLGLRAWFRASRGGVPMLMFHNVGETPGTEYLPHHMKTSERRLRRMLKLLERGGYETITVGAMVEAFERGETPDLGIIFEPAVLQPMLGLAALALLPVVIKAVRGKPGV